MYAGHFLFQLYHLFFSPSLHSSLLFIEDVQNISSCLLKLGCSLGFLSWLLLPFPLGPPSPYPCCGLSCLHSAFPGFLAATLPTYLHACCGNQATITLFLYFSSRVLTHNTFLMQAVVPQRISLLFLFLFNSFPAAFFSITNDRE